MDIEEHTWWITIRAGDHFKECCDAFQRVHPQKDQILKRISHKWDGFVKFWKQGTVDNSLLIRVGFKDRLEEWLKAGGYGYNWVKKTQTQVLKYNPNHLDGITLDPIQCECLEALLGTRRCSIELKTGSGKTEIFLCALACYLEEFPTRKCLIVLPKTALLRDAYQRAQKRLPHLAHLFGILGDGNFKLNQVVFSTPNSIRTNDRLVNSEEISQWRKDIGLLILDEVHHMKASGWKGIASECASEYQWGFSGKVTYTNDLKTMELEEELGKPVYVGGSEVRRVPVTALFYRFPMWDGRFDKDKLFSSLVDGCPFMFKGEDGKWSEGLWRGKNANGKYPDFMLEGRKFIGTVGLYDSTGLTLLDPVPKSEDVVWWRPFDVGVMEFKEVYLWSIKLAEEFTKVGEKWLISCRRTRQLKRLEKMLSGTSMRFKTVDGSLSGKEQNAIFVALNNGDLDGIICNNTIVSEGVDIASLIHYIKIDLISSEQALEQQKGRVERIAAGKTEGFIHVPIFSQHFSLHNSCKKIMAYYNSTLSTRTIT